MLWAWISSTQKNLSLCLTSSRLRHQSPNGTMTLGDLWFSEIIDFAACSMSTLNGKCISPTESWDLPTVLLSFCPIVQLQNFIKWPVQRRIKSRSLEKLVGCTPQKPQHLLAAVLLDHDFPIISKCSWRRFGWVFYMKKRRIQLRHLRVPHTTAFSQFFGIFQYRGFFRSPPKCRKFFASSNSSFSRIYDRLLGGLLKKTTQRNRDIFNQIWNLWLLKPIPLSFLKKRSTVSTDVFFGPVADWHFIVSSNWPKTVK